MKKQKTLNFLKIRGSVGLVGNDLVKGKERFYYLPAEYNPSSGGYNFGTGITTLLPGAVEKKIGNEDVTWEKSLKYTVGLDYKLFKSRLTGSIDLSLGSSIGLNAEDKFYISDFEIAAGETKQIAIQYESDNVENYCGYRSLHNNIFCLDSDFDACTNAVSIL